MKNKKIVRIQKEFLIKTTQLLYFEGNVDVTLPNGDKYQELWSDGELVSSSLTEEQELNFDKWLADITGNINNSQTE